MGDSSGSHPTDHARAGHGASRVDPGRVDRAIALACEAHAGQIDKGGKPYILHPLRVMLRLKDEDAQIAAVLHDTVEDCGLELGLIRYRFGALVADAVDALTRREGESYGAFLGRCADNPLALRVKLEDIEDNLNLDRLGREPTIDDARRCRKYHDARNVLIGRALADHAQLTLNPGN